MTHHSHQGSYPLNQPAQKQQSSQTLGLTALILGCLAAALALIPGAGIIAIAAAVVAIILGIVALAKNAAKTGLALTGIIAASIGGLIAALLTASLGTNPQVLQVFTGPVTEEQTVVLKVSATKRVDINYVLDGSSTTERITGGDWEKTVTGDRNHSVSLMVTKDAWDNVSPKITCEIIIDGKSVVKKSGTEYVFCDHWG